MITQDIKNIILDRSLPAFIRENYKYFELFLSAYYEWCEQQKNGLDLIKNLRNYRDIDTTLDEFIEYFRSEYASSFPAHIAGDPRKFIKFVKKFYSNKGNEASFKFLFYLLYGEDVEFYYPKVDVLRASDGKWQQLVTIKVTQSSILDVSELFSGALEGQTSGAIGYVDTVSSYEERGVLIYELSLNNIRGQFQLGEIITVGNISFNILEVLSTIRIVNGGTRYGVGEKINIRDLNGNIVATGQISTVSRGIVQGLNIINGGIGYKGNLNTVDDFINLPLNYTWNGMNLLEQTIYPQDTNDFDFASQTLSFPIADEFITGNGDIIRITDSPELIGSGAVGVVQLVSPTGVIEQVILLSGGNNYNLPLASVISTTGSGAVIEALGGGGTIFSITLDNFPIISENTNDDLWIEVETVTGQFAALEPQFGGGMIRYKGDWANEDGKLSSIKKLQDNYYYQDFSYVLLSGITESRWSEVIQKIIHPAGLKMFGTFKNTTTLGAETTLIDTINIL